MAPGKLLSTLLVLWVGVAGAGDWSLRFGEMDLEGISVDERVAGDSYHLGFASDTVWFTFSFPAVSGERPSFARAERIDLNGFDPDIRCTELGEQGLLLDGTALRGEVICSRPQGKVELVGRFDN